MMRPQQRAKIEVAGIVDQHGVAGTEQEAADEVGCLGARARQHELVDRRLDRVLGKARKQEPAQCQRAARRAVIGQQALVGTGERADGAAQGCLRHPVRRQPAAARFWHGGISIERLPRDPERIDRPVAARFDLGQRKRRHHCRRHIEAGATTRADQAFGGQTIIGFDDRRRRNTHRNGEAADRGQAVAGTERAARDLGADRAHHVSGPGSSPALRSCLAVQCV
ncbi:hypothetical protein ABIB73_006832 [Bradyrhizobium sp. F1.4.3]